jgi:hypothetical protein
MIYNLRIQLKRDSIIHYLKKIFDENKIWLQSNNSQKSTLTIPVVVHIVHRQTHANIGIGTNIPIEQIEDGLRILNEDYSKTNSEFPNPPRNNFLNVALTVID